jgi:hypothetical protein
MVGQPSTTHQRQHQGATHLMPFFIALFLRMGTGPQGGTPPRFFRAAGLELRHGRSCCPVNLIVLVSQTVLPSKEHEPLFRAMQGIPDRVKARPADTVQGVVDQIGPSDGGRLAPIHLADAAALVAEEV